MQATSVGALGLPDTAHKYWRGRHLLMHSQAETEQDQWVINLLDGVEGGTFIEVGALDGVYHSNTLTLEREFGWSGWLIEALPEYAEKARRARKAKVITAAVGPENGTLTYYVGGQWSGLVDYTRPNLIPGHIEYNNPIVRVATETLQEILSGSRVPPVVDYLSIDVEGAEYPILKSYFESDPQTLFRCMTVEVGERADDLHALWLLLRPFGYELSHIRAWDAYFYHRELCRAGKT